MQAIISCQALQGSTKHICFGNKQYAMKVFYFYFFYHNELKKIFYIVGLLKINSVDFRFCHVVERRVVLVLRLKFLFFSS